MNGDKNSTDKKTFLSRDTLITILIGVVAFIAVKFYYDKVDKIEDRVNDMNIQLANLQGKIDQLLTTTHAQNYTQSDFYTAVATSLPYQNEKGEWQIDVQVFDTDSAEIRTYTVNVESKNDDRIINDLATAVYRTDTGARSFSTMGAYSMQLDQSFTFPMGINTDRSYIILKDTNVNFMFDSILGEPKIIKASDDVGNWHDYSMELSNQKSRFFIDIKKDSR